MRGGSPERASWAGNTPRVISRRASRAVVSDSTQGHEHRRVQLRACRRVRRETGRSSRSGSGVRCGRTCRAMDSLESTPFRVACGDQASAGLGQLVGCASELLDLARQLGGQPGVAEGQAGLVGEVGQQPVLAGAQGSPGRHLDGDAAEPLAAVDHRHLDGRGRSVAACSDAGQRAVTVGPGLDVEQRRWRGSR